MTDPIETIVQKTGEIKSKPQKDNFYTRLQENFLVRPNLTVARMFLEPGYLTRAIHSMSKDDANALGDVPKSASLAMSYVADVARLTLYYNILKSLFS